MKGRKDLKPLDADPEADAALRRALAALALDRPRTEELARVRRRLQPVFEQPPPGRMPVPPAWRLPLLAFVGAAALGATLLGQRLGREATPLPAAAPAQNNIPDRTAVSAPEPQPRIQPEHAEPEHAPSDTSAGPAQTLSERKPLPTRSHKSRVRESSSVKTAAPHVGVAVSAATDPAPAQTPTPETTHNESVPDSSPQPQPRSTEVSEAARPAVPNRPDEVSLLQQARHRAGSDPQAALRFLDEHKRSFPHGTLSPEREVLAIELLRALARNKEAELRASAFQRDFPDSVYLPRVMR